MMQYWVYILGNKKNGTLYIGFTNDLDRRIFEHKYKLLKGFTNKYKIDKLVYFEEYANRDEAFTRERQMKKWKRAWKVKLIEEQNPDWNDLAKNWYANV